MGIIIDAKDHLGQTPIHWPANYGRLIMVNHLISKGADVNAVANLLRKHGGKTGEELKAEWK